MRLLLCEWAGLLLSNLVVPYETTRIIGAATVYLGFVLRGGFFSLSTQHDTSAFIAVILGEAYIELFFMYRSLEYVIFMSCNLRPLRCVILYCNVGWCIKGSAVHHRHQQCLIAEWLGLSVIVRVRARAREWVFSVSFFFFFFFSVCDKNTFV